MNGKSIACSGAALLAGAALAWFLKPVPEPVPAVAPAAARPAKKPIADVGAEATIAALRARIADLENALKAARRLPAGRSPAPKTKAEDAPAEAETPRRGESRRPGMQERLARMAAEDPVRYAQITNRMERMRQNRAANAAARREYLASVDTARMTASAKRTHDALQEAIAKREALEAQLRDENLTDDQRKALFEEMHATERTMRELNRSERDTLLALAAQNMGFSGDEATEVVETIKDVIDATDGGRGGFPPGPPPGDGAPPAP